MGGGESYLGTWWTYLRDVPLAEREAYLKRHPAAPHTWYETVWSVLGEEEPPHDGLEQLVARGLVDSDIAYRTWTRDAQWPWDLSRSLLDAVRYDTRRFAFLSRALANDRRAGPLDPAVPWRWRAVSTAIRSGERGRVNRRRGLRTLGVMLCAGEVQGPWTLGMTLGDVEDSFDHDMNYADAFRLWLMAVFDDVPHFEREVERLAPPADWRAWMDEETYLPRDEPSE
jgi:hypothetical protein